MVERSLRASIRWSTAGFGRAISLSYALSMSPMVITGHTKLKSTVRYPGFEVDDVIE